MMKLCSDGLRKRRRKMLPLEPFDTGRYYPGTEREREAVCSDQWWREGDVFPLIMWDFSKQTELVVMCCFLLLLTRTCVRLRCVSLQSHQDLRLLREVPPSRRLPVDRKRCHILTQRNKNSFSLLVILSNQIRLWHFPQREACSSDFRHLCLY